MTKKRVWLSCSDFASSGYREYDCCPSCHTDDADGYPLCELTVDERDREIIARVCCKVLHWLEGRDQDAEIRKALAANEDKTNG